MDLLQEAIPIEVYQGVLNPPALSTSTCSFGTVYNTINKNCDAVPPMGSPECPRAKPAMESAACTQSRSAARTFNLKSLLELVTVPNAFGFNAATARAKLDAITSRSAAIATGGDGKVNAGQDRIYQYMVRPRLGVPGNTSAIIKITSADFYGRQLRFTYNVSAVDITGSPHLFGPYYGVATFVACSPRIESLYSSSQLSVSKVKGMAEIWPQAVTSTSQKPILGLRRLFQASNTTTNNTTVPPSTPVTTPSPSPSPSPAPAPAPAPTAAFPPFPPPPPAYSVDATNGTFSTEGTQELTVDDLADLFVDAANAVFASAALQNYEFKFSKDCIPSTIDNLQFCDVASGKGIFNIESFDILDDTCNGLCADGAWDAAAAWTCDYGCKAGQDAACSSCKSGCSASCSTCKGSCNTACSACKETVKVGCDACKVGCCYGCVWGKTCNCDGACNTDKICGKDCGCGGCDATCNCDSSCNSACNINCPDCDLECQSNCEQELAAVGINYEFSVDFVKGLGDMLLTDATAVASNKYKFNTTDASATFDTAMNWRGMETRIGFSASLAPDYGLPPIPFTYIGMNFTNTFYVKKAQFNVVQDCVVPWDEKPTGKLIVSLPEFVLESTWVSWQAIYDTMFAWVDFLGNSWLEDASKAIANDINALIDDEASGLLQDILDGVLQDVYFGSVDCSVFAR